MTNNSTKSRKGYLGKFLSLGLNINAEEIYSSSYAAAAYLESINFPKNKKVRRSIGSSVLTGTVVGTRDRHSGSGPLGLLESMSFPENRD